MSTICCCSLAGTSACRTCSNASFMYTNTTVSIPAKRFCKISGDMCALATEFGYCQLTACIKRDNKWGGI